MDSKALLEIKLLSFHALSVFTSSICFIVSILNNVLNSSMPRVSFLRKNKQAYVNEKNMVKENLIIYRAIVR